MKTLHICFCMLFVILSANAHNYGYIIKPSMQIPDSLVGNIQAVIVLTIFVDDEGKIPGWQLDAIDTWNKKKNRAERLYEENPVWYIWNYQQKRFESRVRKQIKLTNTELGKKLAVKLLPWLGDYVNHIQFNITDAAALKRRKERELGKFTLTYTVLVNTKIPVDTRF